MAGPWEKYANPAPVAEPAVAAGPWTRYQPQGGGSDPALGAAPGMVDLPAYDAMGNATGGSMAVAVPGPAAPGGDALTAVWRGGAQGATLGFSDEVMGGMSRLTGGDYASARDATRAANDADYEAQPWAYNGGKIVGAVAAPLVAAFAAPEAAIGAAGSERRPPPVPTSRSGHR